MKVYEWTRDDFDFVARVAHAVRACGLADISDDSTWSAFGFCANRWGPCSPAAIGCLRELVREAWDDDTIACETTSNASDLLLIRVMRFDGMRRMEPLLPHICGDESEALVFALEAKR